MKTHSHLQLVHRERRYDQTLLVVLVHALSFMMLDRVFELGCHRESESDWRAASRQAIVRWC